ncbi:hypothetical protein D5396_16845 [Rahnella inusitata]|jgi:hypothetical protein|uniref:Uncharacterized protein n=1 Tax=Rahnella inusitata TaxID=58169 RepID=A0ABX9P061_9GAMM|nr:hypothetical protein [Serratia sp. (in: enterobacteria)]QLK59685.1 hypothetical protein GE278_02305 [Enterobacteriaceae bacterium Kacie_13]RJT11487.1 hypothetical protein D5396_16845 [Rahnella inusitata]
MIFRQKGFALCGRLLYNLATPRYYKVFFPKLYKCQHWLFEGVGLLDDGRVNLKYLFYKQVSVRVFANV